MGKKKKKKSNGKVNVSSQDEPLFPGSAVWRFLRGPSGSAELIACAATSCCKQPHAEVQKVRLADSEMDEAVRAGVSGESRCRCQCVTDMSNPLRKHLGCCLSRCRTDWLSG